MTVLQYYKYLGSDSQSVYHTEYFCGSCRRDLGKPYTFPKYPEDLEAENETMMGLTPWDKSSGELEHYAFCPWCGTELPDEWWKDRTIQNERVIDHYKNPGTHKGDTHEFRGQGLECMENHWLGVTSSDEVCWCDPEIKPGIMGCIIRHQDKRYEDYLALHEEWRDGEES